MSRSLRILLGAATVAIAAALSVPAAAAPDPSQVLAGPERCC